MFRLGPLTKNHVDELLDWLEARGCSCLGLSLRDEGFYLSFASDTLRAAGREGLVPLPAMIAYPAQLLFKNLEAG